MNLLRVAALSLVLSLFLVLPACDSSSDDATAADTTTATTDTVSTADGATAPDAAPAADMGSPTPDVPGPPPDVPAPDMGSPDVGPSGDPVAGQKLYMASCGGDYCHGSDGDSGSAPNHSVVIPTFSDAEIEDIVKNGRGYMAPQTLTDQEFLDVLAYLRATFP